jgi:hypothetical protein
VELSGSVTIENSRNLLVTVARFLDAQEIPYLVDGGTLLGIVRDGDLIPYDTDLDFSLFDRDIERVLASRESLAELGISLRFSTYRGKPYTLSLGWRRRRNLALHAHVFTRSPGGFFWCPQIVKHFKWPGTVGAILAGRRHTKQIEETSDSEPPRLSDWSGKVWSRASLPSFPVYTLAKFALRAMGRADRQSWGESFAGRALYTRFTWVVPSRFFEASEKVEWGGETVRIPAAADRYIAYKFGDDWQQKKPDWVYFVDDRTIYFGGPEAVVPQLERARSSPNNASS